MILVLFRPVLGLCATVPLRSQLPTSFAQDWDQLVGEYFHIKDALVADNTWGASMAAARMVRDMADMRVAGLTAAQAEGWHQFHNALRSPADEIAGAPDVVIQRDQFKRLSQVVQAGVQVIGAGPLHIYVQHCPMADRGQGADWLSLHSVVQNPYYGAAMLHCGKVQAYYPGVAAAPAMAADVLPGRLQSPVMHGCHGAGR